MRHSARFLAGLCLALGLLGGCTATKPPPYEGLGYTGNLVPGKEVTVGRGENVYTIARNHGVRMREIIALNNLQPPFLLKPGQRLVLPAKTGGNGAGSVGEPLPSASPLMPIDKAPVPGAPPPAPVGSGIGGVTAVPLAPPEKPAASAPTAQANNPAMPFGPPTTDVPPPEVQTTVAQAAPQAGPDNAEKTASAAPSASAPSSGFIWPVQGPILSSYGAHGQGVNNDGLNIGAPKGAPVVAAAGGTVVYAGDDMKGFGKLVLIRHEGDFVTAYAHMDRMIVTKDSVVAAGDMIGTVGTSGGVAAPQLHFEIRQDGKPIDPQNFLKK